MISNCLKENALWKGLYLFKVDKTRIQNLRKWGAGRDCFHVYGPICIRKNKITESLLRVCIVGEKIVISELIVFEWFRKQMSCWNKFQVMSRFLPQYHTCATWYVVVVNLKSAPYYRAGLATDLTWKVQQHLLKIKIMFHGNKTSQSRNSYNSRLDIYKGLPYRKTETAGEHEWTRRNVTLPRFMLIIMSWPCPWEKRCSFLDSLSRYIKKWSIWRHLCVSDLEIRNPYIFMVSCL